jgi:hypothetical protein
LQHITTSRGTQPAVVRDSFILEVVHGTEDSQDIDPYHSPSSSYFSSHIQGHPIFSKRKVSVLYIKNVWFFMCMFVWMNECFKKSNKVE